MTGIERLRELIDGILPNTRVCLITKASYDSEHPERMEARLRGFLVDIADQIERETQPKRDAAEDVSVSAYDLLPQDERDAVAWVREHGGLDSVKKLLDWVIGHCSTKQQLDFDFWLSGRVMHELGFDEDMADRDEVERGLLARLMPDGMEWPRFEDGEPVRFKGGFLDHQGNVRSVLTIKMWQEGGFEIGTGQGTYDWHSAGERVKRPPVPAADGKPLREGEHVYHVETGAELVVKELPKPEEYQAVVVFAPPASHLTSFDPDQLTHERPDSWERLEEDVTLSVERYRELYEIKKNDGMTWPQLVRKDLVRRCRALAERGE